MYKKQFMDLAVEVAYEGINKGCGGPFGCVIVKDGEVIAKAHNTVVGDNDPTAHGEMNAIRQAGKVLGNFNLEGCELYTTSEPCPMCLSAIMWARIRKVYSGLEIEDAAVIGFDDKPFYEEIFQYAVDKDINLVDVEFHREKNCKELFRKYDNMEKVLY